MIPLRDVIPARTTPWVSLAFMATAVAVFVVELTLASETHADVVRRFGFAPGAFSFIAVITALFVHAGWLHLLSNVLALWIVGENVEDRMGHGRTALLFVLAALSAAMAASVATSDRESSVVLAGASGAVAGMMGAYFVLFPQSKVLVLVPVWLRLDAVEVPTVFYAGVWILIQTIAGATDVAGLPATSLLTFWAIAGGFVAGAASGWLLRRRDRDHASWWSP